MMTSGLAHCLLTVPLCTTVRIFIMGNTNTVAQRLKAIQLFNKCELQQFLLPEYHRATIIREHLALKSAIGKKEFSSADWVVYFNHMRAFIDALPKPPSDDEICNAIEFYRLVDRRGDLPSEFSVDDRRRIFEHHDSLKELKDLTMSLIRKDYASLFAYKNTMYAKFTSVSPPTYAK